eukprot:COSAG01_NODE_24154_length_788_cov_2.352875_1_plen_23_part_10
MPPPRQRQQCHVAGVAAAAQVSA